MFRHSTNARAQTFVKYSRVAAILLLVAYVAIIVFTDNSIWEDRSCLTGGCEYCLTNSSCTTSRYDYFPFCTWNNGHCE